MTVPGKEHPDYWLYEQLQTIQMLLLAMALEQEGQEQESSDLLDEARKRIIGA
ncbi:MAG: hypothetical protein KGN02_07675 [bacterium]|nr:hypothetical protein [bacterium]